MSLVVANRVQETCTSPGVGAVSLLGAVFQFIPFSSKLSNGDTTFYVIADQFGANWETGLGTYASSGNTIARTTVLSSSNGGALVNFSSGTQNIWNDYPAEYAIYASNNASQVIGQTLISGGAGVSPAWGNATSPPGSPGYYGQFYDTTIQTATLSTVAYLVGCATTSISNGVSISAGRITVANAGIYNFQFSIQLTNPTTAIAETTFWVRYNSVDIADSASTTGVPIKHGGISGQMILSLNQVFNMAAGDYLELWWHSDVAGVLIETLPATTVPTVPQSPGVILTMLQQAQIGIGYNGLTSATSTLIAIGSKTFTTNLTNLQTAFVVGTRVRVAYSVTPANFMEGVVTAFTGTTFTVNVDSIGGSGTFASWTISVAGIQGSNGVTSITGTANQVIASASTGAVTLSLPQSINSGAAPTFLGTNFTGTASLNINGTVGATTATTGAFTSITASTNITLGADYTTSALKIGANGSYIGRQTSDGSLNINTGQANINFNINGAVSAYINNTGVTSTLGYYVGTQGSSILRNGGDGSTTITTGNNSYIKYVLTGSEKIRFTATGGLNLGTYTNDPGLGSIIMSGLTATNAAAPTIASATTIAPTKAITFISGVTPVVTITAPSPISLGGGTITLIPTGIFTTTIAGNIALASTAVVGRALTMTYDVTTAKWYPSY